jgi:hypothetical protein
MTGFADGCSKRMSVLNSESDFLMASALRREWIAPGGRETSFLREASLPRKSGKVANSLCHTNIR